MRSFHKIMMLAAGVMLAGTMAAGNAQALTKPGTPSVGSSVELAKYKAKHKAKHKKAKKKKVGPGYCGTYKYWDSKKRSCADATKKK